MQERNDIMSVDAMMDERYGKVGTPEREAFRKEAYAYCVGQIISDARKREKVTQQELAQRVGTNKSYISRIENGSVEPGAGMFLRILSALGLRFEVSQPLAFGQPLEYSFQIAERNELFMEKLKQIRRIAAIF